MTRPRMLTKATKPPARQKGKRPHPQQARKPARIALQPLSPAGARWLQDVKAELGTLSHSLANHFHSLERILRLEEAIQRELETEVFSRGQDGELQASPLFKQAKLVHQMKRDVMRDLALVDVRVTGQKHWQHRGAKVRRLRRQARRQHAHQQELR